MTVLDGVSNFFGFLFSKLAYSWHLWSLLVITVIFFVLQVGFLYIYARVFRVVFRTLPSVRYLIKRFMA